MTVPPPGEPYQAGPQPWPPQPPSGYGYPGYGYPPQPARGAPPPSHIGWAITAMIFFWPLAIPAFIYSNRVATAWYTGDVRGARQASGNARTCGIVALIVGLVFVLFFIIFEIAVANDVSRCVSVPASRGC